MHLLGPRDAAVRQPSAATHRAWRLVRRLGRRLDVRRREGLAVLNYHRVGQPRTDPWSIAVSPVHFDAQLGVLRRTGAIVPLARELDHGVRRLAHGRRVAALTFDDGYADNLHAAVPLLERHDAPATVFVATDFLDQPSFWWDDLAELILVETLTPDELDEAFRSLGAQAPPGIAAADGLARAHAALYDVLVDRPRQEIEDWIAERSAQRSAVTSRADRRPLTTDELVRLAAHPLVSIGVHTAGHRRLGKLDRANVAEELRSGRSRLDELLGPRERLLAYPYGHVSDVVVGEARQLGFRHAFTTDSRRASLADDPLRIPRLHPDDLSAEPFERWLRAS